MTAESGDEKKGEALPKWTLWLGFVFATVLAIVGLYQFVFNDFLKTTKVRLTSPNSLSLTYQPKGEIIEVSFSFTIENSGGTEVIEQSTAKIVNAAFVTSDGINFVPFATTDIQFTEKNDRFFCPFPVDKGSKVLTCYLTHRLGERSRRVLETPGTLELLVFYNGKNGSDYNLRACFVLDPAKLKSSRIQKQVFINTVCD
jgi:hypothetical protein